MKNRIILITFLVLSVIFPSKVFAIDYECDISGEDVIRAKTDGWDYEEWKPQYLTDMYINVSNIENIGEFTMYVNYDKDTVGLYGCNSFNYITEGCPIASSRNREVFYNYKYSNTNSERLNKYSLYTVTFAPKDNTPKIGDTKVTVYFENAKDINGNPISIKSCSKIYNFRKMGMFATPPVLSDDNTKITNILNKTYNGNYQNQNIKVTYYDTELEQDIDYTVTYKNNLNAGTATVIIEGIGLYEGQIAKTFKIKPIVINQNNTKIIGIKDKIYTGKTISQNVKAELNGKNITYTVSYKNNKNIGKGTVIIKGTGNYVGTITKTFKILPPKAAVSKISRARHSISLKWKKINGVSGYQIAFRKMGPNKYKYYNTTANTKKFTKLKSKKYHQMKVRAYKIIDGKKYYGAWSNVKKARTK